ncbi:hypothetical protein LX81_02041 [Palleronia aestuarii]|uniref:Uncharacterized protein n=1 Tax=Palleronia aestuarii TaxID=568105 RepID=A0A2W7N839_9RHOB|nr:hypothetical protein [Palleronia aestuarii]PZX16190.1 hypothetical protein LX81_02041 [Palleronia aestuarii]
MRNILGLALVIIVVIAILVYAGVLNLTPDGERALEDAQRNVGEAVEDAGRAIQGSGN